MKFYPVLFLLLGITSLLFAQKDDPMRVIRCDAVDTRSPIRNIYVDENNRKWVGNEEGLFIVHAVDYATRADLAPGESSLIWYPGGNFDISWKPEALNNAMGIVVEGDNEITSGYFDRAKKELWVGTSSFGLYCLATEPQLRLKAHFTNKNSRLKSNYINTIFRDSSGTFWIGTRQGALKGNGEKWKLMEDREDVRQFTEKSGEIWLLSYGEIYIVDRKDDWYYYDLPADAREGELVDIEFDQEGNLWLASRIVSRYNLETEKYTPFGPAEYFTSEYASCLAVDRDGAIWVGTEDKGLYLIEKQDVVTVSVAITQGLSCDGSQTDGALKAGVIGGVPPYTYEWSTGQASETLKGIGVGAYSVTVTDSKGQQGIGRESLPNPQIQLVVEVLEKESGLDRQDGRAQVTIEGGVPEYAIRWDNGEQEALAEQLTAGIHTVTVTDRFGCSASAEVEIPGKTKVLTALIEESQAISCASKADGGLSVKVDGGRPPYEYRWSSSALEGSSPEGLSEGRYNLTVTDADGKTSEASLLVQAPPPLEVTLSVERSADLEQANGRAVAKVSGGTGPYSFAWNNGEAGARAEQLAAGEASVTITDQNGCSITAQVNIQEEIQPLRVTLREVNSVDCAGQTTGAIAAEVEGGKPPLSFTWNREDRTGASIENLSAGQYSVTVTDGSGLSQTATLALSAPAPLEVRVVQEASATTNQADGKALAEATGGVDSYSFAWSNGQSGARAKNLAAGNYQVTVTDQKGCTATTDFSMTEDIQPLVLELEEKQSVLCRGGSEGVLIANARGGKPPYIYNWSVGQGDESELSGLAAGDYELTLTDAAGNTQSTSIVLKEPAALSGKVDIQSSANVNQEDGRAEVLMVAGGESPFSYNWSNGETKAEAKNLGAGPHQVTVTDANGCTLILEVEMTEDIQPLRANLVQVEPIKCPGQATGGFSAEVRGGKPPYNYEWSSEKGVGNSLTGLEAGAYAVTITDAAGTSATAESTLEAPQPMRAGISVEAAASVNQENGRAIATLEGGGEGPFTFAWSNGETQARAERLAPGTHSLTITDANGCTVEVSTEITEDIQPLQSAIEQVAVIACAGDQTAALKVEVKGGKPPYTYEWKDQRLSGAAPEGLTSGNYQLTVSDAADNLQTLSIQIEQPDPLELSVKKSSNSSVGAADGKAAAKVKGGTPPYRWDWDNGEETAEAQALAPGDRRITVTDANGCTAEESVRIAEDTTALEVTLVNQSNPACSGGEDGAIALEMKGGKPPYQYQWSTGATAGAELTQIGAGTYTVTITDGFQQQLIREYILTDPEVLQLTIVSKRPATNASSKDGKAVVSASGGTPPYSFKWSTGAAGEEVLNLPMGSHQITLTDANGCEASELLEIKRRIIPELSASDLKAGQTIRMQQLNFEADSININEASMPVLEEMYEFLADNPTIVVEIGGHTNGIPEHKYCDWLSTQRAKAVADYIVAKGIDGRRVYYKGYGKREPIATNQTESGRRKNQRVEIKILEVEE